MHSRPTRPSPRVATDPRRHRLLALAALAVIVIALLTAMLLNRNAPTPASSLTAPPSTATGAPGASAPTTTARSGTAPSSGAAVVTAPATGVSTATGASPAIAASPATGPSTADITKDVDNYYALVNQHQLNQSFGWLSPAYQQRIGFTYYRQFWNSITQISVLSVTPGNNSATVILRYVEANGTTSTEHAAITFIHDASGKLLIDTYRSI
jgi:hypothetical protein